MTGPHSLQQSARVMAAVEREMIAAPIYAPEFLRYHSDPDYHAAIDAKRDALRAEINATMDAAIVRASGPHPFWPDERNQAAMERLSHGKA